MQVQQAQEKNLLPEFPDFPVYVDSPLGNEATAVFLQCSLDCLDEETRGIMREGYNPIWFDGLITTVSSEESKALNTNTQCKVIIASGGMCEGGRIRHHLKHNLWNEKNTILFVGYQAAGTLGRIIYDGASSVKIFGESIDVKAEIRLLQGISGHADQNGLLSWISSCEKKPEYVFVNHGDDDSCTQFASAVTEQFGIPADAPYAGSEYDLLKGEWIRIAGPVRRKQKKTAPSEPAFAERKKKSTAYRILRDAVAALDRYTEGLSGHSNSELNSLAEKIRRLISGQD